MVSNLPVEHRGTEVDTGKPETENAMDLCALSDVQSRVFQVWHY